MKDTTTVQSPADHHGLPRRVVLGHLALPRTFHALRHRNFRLFMTGQLVSLIGTWMEQTAMGWLVYQITGSQFLLGAVAAAGTTPMLFFSMWGGSIADRFPKRNILIATQTAAMVFAFNIAALVWFGHVQPWQIVLIAMLNGTAMAFDAPARQAFILETIGRGVAGGCYRGRKIFRSGDDLRRIVAFLGGALAIRDDTESAAGHRAPGGGTLWDDSLSRLLAVHVAADHTG